MDQDDRVAFPGLQPPHGRSVDDGLLQLCGAHRRPREARQAARASGSASGSVAIWASAASVHQEQTARCLVTCSASR
ncbi:hypothetical protein SAMN05661080_01955 [Modestobacter sp. DSM 44400]|nr:hypothetical protein SAMN05661080_01955 [Modestobacter sp. DSM 44400]